jgi:hypothetical protein
LIDPNKAKLEQIFAPMASTAATFSMKAGLSFTLFPFAFRHGVLPSLGVSPPPPELGSRSFCQTRLAPLFPPILQFKCYSQLSLISFAMIVDVFNGR